MPPASLPDTSRFRVDPWLRSLKLSWRPSWWSVSKTQFVTTGPSTIPPIHSSDSTMRLSGATTRGWAGTTRTFIACGAGDLRATFDAQVVGPTFESTSRFWATHFAEPGLFGEQPVHVGPTVTRAPDGSEIQVDVIAAADDSDSPSGRTILALGEAKSGERLTETHVRRLEAARSGFGARAAEAKLILFGTEFAPDLEATTRRRRDLELVGLPRLYGESGAR